MTVRLSNPARVILGLFIALSLPFVFFACASPTPALPTPIPPTPTPALPSFQGRLFFDSSEGIIELKYLGEGQLLEMVPLIGKAGVIFSAGSLYENNYLYVDTSRNMVILKDLESGQERDLFKLPGEVLSQEDLDWYGGAVKCFSWSTDGKWISFVGLNGELSLFELDGASESFTLYTPPSALYALGGVGPVESHYASTSCASWIGPDRLVFESFSGELPAQIAAGSGDIPANTTFMASPHNGAWTITDTVADMVGILQVSPDDSMLIYGETDQVGTFRLYLSQSIQRFDELEKRALPIKGDLSPSMYPFSYQFTADGEGIIIQETVLEPDWSGPSLTLVDVKTLTSRVLFNVPRSWQVKSELFWMGDPSKGLVGFIQKEDTELFLRIGDLKTGLLARYPIDVSQTSSWKLLKMPPTMTFLTWLP